MTTLSEQARSAIGAALQAAGRGSPQPALHHLKLTNTRDGFSCVGSDSRLQVTANAPALDGGEFDICVNAERLGKVLGSVRGDISIKVNDKAVSVAAGGSRFSLPLFGEEFPLMPAHQVEREITIETDMLREALEKVLPFAAVSDIGRPMFEGMALQCAGTELHFVATNGAGMGVLRKDLEEGAEFSTIIPGNTCRKLKGLLLADEVTIRIGGRITFVCGDIMVDAPSLDFRYPDWRRALPTSRKGKVIVKAEAAFSVFSDALIVGTPAKGMAWGDISIDAKGIEVSARTSDGGEYNGLIDCSPSIPGRNSFNLVTLREVFSLFPRAADVVIEYEPSGAHAYVFKSEAMPGYTAVFTPART